jgi:hypothetical protein
MLSLIPKFMQSETYLAFPQSKNRQLIQRRQPRLLDDKYRHESDIGKSLRFQVRRPGVT